MCVYHDWYHHNIKQYSAAWSVVYKLNNKVIMHWKLIVSLL